jgi:hypothetical protein
MKGKLANTEGSDILRNNAATNFGHQAIVRKKKNRRVI